MKQTFVAVWRAFVEIFTISIFASAIFTLCAAVYTYFTGHGTMLKIGPKWYDLPSDTQGALAVSIILWILFGIIWFFRREKKS